MNEGNLGKEGGKTNLEFASEGLISFD